MLLFNNITWYSLVAWFVVLGALILINEFARKSKVFSVILCTASIREASRCLLRALNQGKSMNS